MDNSPLRASALEPEYVILGLLTQRPGHGYDLHRRLQSEFRALWHIPQNQLYAILRRLETRGDIIAEERTSSAGPPRRLYGVTRRGRARFRRWLERPTPMSVRALRVAFLTRLEFALAHDRATAIRLFDAQRQALQEGLSRFKQLVPDSAEAGKLDRLSLDLRIRQLQTTLAWMESARVELGLLP
jgi:DNA-binding PadR family transcriptional regulator